MDDIKTQAQPTAEQQFINGLRIATSPQHKALESTPLSAILVSDDLSVTDYASYLLHMQQVISFCEKTVFPVVAHLIPDIEQRRKLSLINTDIEVLAGKVPMPHIPVYHAAIPSGNIPFALGFMYVTEGSTLGGRMLLNHVKDTLGFDEQSGASFFAGYGSASGLMWKDFLRLFSSYAVRHNAAAAITQGAIYAFKSIEDFFAQAK